MHQHATWYGGRSQPRRLCVRWGPSLLPQKGGASSPIFLICQLWPNGWMDQDGSWHGGGRWSRPHCARWGPSSPPPKKVTEPSSPIFGPCLLWPNGCMYQDTTWYGGRSQPRRHCVTWGPTSPILNGHCPQFSATVHCGRTAGWTNMPLVMEVGLGPGDFVFDGDPAARRKKEYSPLPIF